MVMKQKLPPRWGLMVKTGTELTATVDALQLEPQPIDRGFMAALLRREQKYGSYDMYKCPDPDCVQATLIRKSKP